MENIFEMGCLIQLSTSIWGARRKIKTEQITNMAAANEWLSTQKKLIDPCALKPIQKVANAARGYLSGVSLPFPINGMVFVPKEMISKVDDQLTQFQSDFDNKVADFMDRYDRLRETAMVYLGDLLMKQITRWISPESFPLPGGSSISMCQTAEPVSFHRRCTSGKNKSSFKPWRMPGNWPS